MFPIGNNPFSSLPLTRLAQNGIKRDDAAYILDTFPIVREQDEKAHGRFLTKDLILAYLNAVDAGDLETTVSV